MRVKGDLVFQDAKDEVSEQAHGRADDHHFAFTFLGQTNGQSLHTLVITQGGQGWKIERFAQAPMAQFAQMAASTKNTD